MIAKVGDWTDMHSDEQYGTLRWFGPSWGAPACRPQTQVYLPAGTLCSMCEEPIATIQSGVRIPYLAPYERWAHYHLACFKSIIMPGNADWDTQ